MAAGNAHLTDQVSAAAPPLDRAATPSPLSRYRKGSVLTAVAQRAAGLLLTEHHSTLYQADVYAPLPEVTPPVPVDIKLATGNDFAELEAMAPSRVQEYRHRMRRRDTCIIARYKGRIVSYVWLTCHDHREPTLRISIPLGEDCCLGYDAFILPEVRGLGLRDRLHVEERRQCRRLGRGRLLFCLDGSDASPLARRRAELGFDQTAIADIVTYHLFGRVWLSHVEWFEDASG